MDSDATSIDMAQSAPPRPTCTKYNSSFGCQSDLEHHDKVHQATSEIFRSAAAGCEYGSYRKDRLNEHIKHRHQALRAASKLGLDAVVG